MFLLKETDNFDNTQYIITSKIKTKTKTRVLTNVIK